jgi:signal transduction histidine kinase
MSNAVKFTPEGGSVTVKAWSEPESGYFFQIIDTGIGVTPENIPKAFSSFGQIDSQLAKRYEGSGLGLPISKALIELGGGVLEMQSEVGKGTTMTIRFPRERIVQTPPVKISSAAAE